MRNELKYPVKYAVLELKEQGGFSAGYEDITQGFIVSKCYVVGSEIKYYSNGKYDITYKVVFPFKNISNFKLSLYRGKSYDCYETVPLYDAIGNPYPTDIVTRLFDNYEEAKEILLQKNEEVEENLILKISLLDENWKEKYEKLKKEFLDNLNICYQFEEFIASKTESMIISDSQVEISEKKLQKKKF